MKYLRQCLASILILIMCMTSIPVYAIDVGVPSTFASICTVTIYYDFYESDGTTLEKTQKKKTASVARGNSFSYTSSDVDCYENKGQGSYGLKFFDKTIYYNEEVHFKYVRTHYKVTVVDKLYFANGDEKASYTRYTDKLAAGTTYTYYDKLSYYNRDDSIAYEMVSDTVQTGIADSDKTITFEYKMQYRIRVYDIVSNCYGDEIISGDDALRTTDIYDYGDTYTYEPLDKYADCTFESVYIDNDTYGSCDPIVTGTTNGAYGSCDIYFKYSMPHMTTCKITVVDEFTDENGVVTSNIRSVDSLRCHTNYRYSALDTIPEGYSLISNSEYIGQAYENKKLVFKYSKPRQTYKITIKDTFGYSDSKTRIIEHKQAGSEYNYSSLNDLEEYEYNYAIVNPGNNYNYNDICSGIVNSDITIEFKYSRISSSVSYKYLYIKDEFYSESGSRLSSISRPSMELPEGTEYTAYARDDFEVIGDSVQTVTLNSYSTYITFKYKVESTPVTINVHHVFYESLNDYNNHIVDRTEDEVFNINAGDSFYYDNRAQEGYNTVKVEEPKYPIYKYKGGEITISYIRTSQQWYETTLKFVDENGNEIKSFTEEECIYNPTSNRDYYIEARNFDGFDIVGPTSYSGNFDEDAHFGGLNYNGTLERTFTYKKNTDKSVVFIENEGFDGFATIFTKLQDVKLCNRGDIFEVSATPYYDKYNICNERIDRFVVSDSTDCYDTVIRNNVGDFSFNGIIDQDYYTVDFNYGCSPISTINVYDIFEDENGNAINTSKRCSEKKSVLQSYTYNALNTSGYEVLGSSSYTNTVTSDIDGNIDDGTLNNDGNIFFFYRPVSTCNITVTDKYITENGVVITVDTRTVDSMNVGDTYTYNALSPAGYEVQGATTYSGTAVGDTTIEFVYKKVSSTPVTPPEGGGTPPVTPPVTPPTTPPVVPPTINPNPVEEEKPKYFNLKVVDNYYKGELLQDSVIRVNDSVKWGTPYNYQALNVKDYEVDGTDSYTGVVTQDTELIFNYKNDELNKYTLKVIDVYYDSEGNVVKTKVRTERVVDEGTSYSYIARNSDKYKVADSTKYSGTVMEDTILVFSYYKLSSSNNGGTFTPEDKPDTPKPNPTEPEDSKIDNTTPEDRNTEPSEDSPIDPAPESNPDDSNQDDRSEDSNPDDNSPEDSEDGKPAIDTEDAKTYTIKVIDKFIISKDEYNNLQKFNAAFAGREKASAASKIDDSYYIVTVDRIERCVDTYVEGADYSYKALNAKGWKLDSNSSFNGTVTEDMTLEFVYVRQAKNLYEISDNPEPEEQEDIKIEHKEEQVPEEKSIPVIPSVACLAGLGSIGVLIKFKRK